MACTALLAGCGVGRRPETTAVPPADRGRRVPVRRISVIGREASAGISATSIGPPLSSRALGAGLRRRPLLRLSFRGRWVRKRRRNNGCRDGGIVRFGSGRPPGPAWSPPPRARPRWPSMPEAAPTCSVTSGRLGSSAPAHDRVQPWRGPQPSSARRASYSFLPTPKTVPRRASSYTEAMVKSMRSKVA